MTTKRGKPAHDPFNLIITGVGGQGNVLASRVVGDMLTRRGYDVTIGETFGASQRGGSVMSHLRISRRGVFSPQIPRGRAHMVVALEPAEAIRVLNVYGNPGVKVLCNTRPIQPVGVICGDLNYPAPRKVVEWIQELSAEAWFFDPSKEAIELGTPVVANIMTVGALAATEVLPLHRSVFQEVVRMQFPAEKMAVNLKAFEMGAGMVRTAGDSKNGC
jgi:indolepyruvate ferredoxin oxidoreductase beta subunit